MKCQNCQMENANNAAFCVNCGQKLSVPAQAAPQNKVVRCQNGHFYDTAKYAACPHCGASAGEASPTSPVMQAPLFSPHTGKKVKPEKQKKSLFGFFNKGQNENTAPQQPVVSVNPPAGGNPYNQVDHTIALMDIEEEEPVVAAPVAEEGMRNAKKAIVHHASEPTPAVQAPAEAPAPAEEMPVEQPVMEAAAKVSTPVPDPVRPAAAVEEPKPVVSRPVRPAAAPVTDSSKTIAIYGDLGEEEPVVGWLVCISGTENFGKSFTLMAGKNRIGRSPMMDVALEGESSVSRDTHCTVIYEPKKRVFILQAGENRSLTYRNEELIMEHQVLQAYDRIQLGECVLLFVPLCGAEFSWEDCENKF